MTTTTRTYQEVTVRKTTGRFNERTTKIVKVYGSRSEAQDTASYLGRQGYLLLDIIQKEDEEFDGEIVTTTIVRSLELGDVIVGVDSLDHWITAVVTELHPYRRATGTTEIRVEFLNPDDGYGATGRTIVAGNYELVKIGGTK